MKYARISFPSREVAVRAYHELGRRGRIVSLPDGQFIVPEPAVQFLQTQGLAHETHEWMHEDAVTQTPQGGKSEQWEADVRRSSPHPPHPPRCYTCRR